MAYTVWLKNELLATPIEQATISDYKVENSSLTMFKIDGKIKKIKQIFKEEQGNWNFVPTEQEEYEDFSIIVNRNQIIKIEEE